MYYDLHVHSNKSDGQLSRTDILKTANDIGLEYIAITDHDYFDETICTSKYKTLKIINGVEITIGDVKNMHVLGYDIKNYNLLKSKLSELRLQNIEICKNLINNLRKNYGFDIYYEYFEPETISKGKIRNYLVSKGYADNATIAGDLYTGSKSKNYEKTEALKYEDAIKLINDCHGIAVLAHPGTLKLTDDDLEKLIINMKDMGLRGIEVLNKSKITKQQIIYELLAQKYDLLTSCGSDFHRYENNVNIGVNNNKSLKLIKKINERNV